MKSRFLFCISFIQVGTPALSTPDAVLRLSKTRIAEQLQKNYQLEAAFDSDRCEQKVTYELFPEGMRMSSTGNFWKAPLYLGYQELLDGQKINFPVDLERTHNHQGEETLRSSPNQSPGASTPTKKMIVWGTALGLGAVASWYSYKHLRGPKTQAPQIGFVRSF